jgi:hypothetical protein
MTSNTGRKRRKGKAKAMISLPGETAVPQAQTTGPRRDRPADAAGTALEARCRVFGVRDTPDNRKALSAPLWGCSVGRRILEIGDVHRAELWNAVYHARRTQAAYDRAIGAPNRFAQVARILAPVDAMHADATSPALDTRTVEERVRQATTAQMQVEGWLGYCDNPAQSAFKHAVINAPDDPIRDWPGVLNCLWCIVEGLAGGKVQARVRK